MLHRQKAQDWPGVYSVLSAGCWPGPVSEENLKLEREPHDRTRGNSAQPTQCQESSHHPSGKSTDWNIQKVWPQYKSKLPDSQAISRKLNGIYRVMNFSFKELHLCPTFCWRLWAGQSSDQIEFRSVQIAKEEINSLEELIQLTVIETDKWIQQCW